MLKVPPDDRTDACGASDALPSEGTRHDRIAEEVKSDTKSDPRKGNRSSLGRGLVTKPSTAIENMILK